MDGRIPLFGFAHLEYPSGELNPNGQGDVSWNFLLPVDQELFRAMNRVRNGGDVTGGLVVALAGLEFRDEAWQPVQLKVRNADDTAYGIVPFRIPRSDWDEFRLTLGYHSPSAPERVLTRLRTTLTALGRIRLIAAIAGAVRHIFT